MELITAGIQLSSLPGYVAILIIGAYLWRREPGFRGALVMPMLWAGYGAAYYGLVLAGQFTPAELLLWGAIHRWIAMFMILGGVIVNLLVLRDGPIELDEEQDAMGEDEPA